MSDDPRDGLWQTYKAFMGTLRQAMVAMTEDKDDGMISRAKSAAAKAGLEGFLRGMDAKVAKSLREMSPDDARGLCAKILTGFEDIIGPLRAYTAPNGSHGIGGDDRQRQDHLGTAATQLLSGGSRP
jgi:hypothetical protein